ncbi:MAG: zinc ribbon domain-containing protein [Candidatus Omnitrophica bacterium]|nr:zinc ribbon domain-containing protein [Candidatus Omnitrophota bacterium]
MALIECPECSKQISDKAESCPNCGCPIKKKPVTVEKNKGIGGCSGCLILVIGFFILMAIIPHDNDDTSSKKKQTQTSSFVDLDASVTFKLNEVIIENKNSFDWYNVKAEANPRILGSGYYYEFKGLAAGDSKSISLSEFAKSDGTRFNHLATKLTAFSIHCDTKSGRGHYYGERKTP